MAVRHNEGRPFAQNRRIGRGGMLTALTVIFVFFGGIFPTANIAVFSLASLCITIAVTDMNIRFALMVYLASAGISLAWPGIFAAWPFIFFFGPYPLWHYVMDKHLHGLAAWLGKSLLAHLFFWLAAPIFARMQLQQLSEQFGLAFWLGLPIIIQFVFMMYQYGLNLLLTYYKIRLSRQRIC